MISSPAHHLVIAVRQQHNRHQFCQPRKKSWRSQSAYVVQFSPAYTNSPEHGKYFVLFLAHLISRLFHILHCRVYFWRNFWRSVGYPRSGTVNSNRLQCKYSYEMAIKGILYHILHFLALLTDSVGVVYKTWIPVICSSWSCCCFLLSLYNCSIRKRSSVCNWHTI